MPVNSSNTGTLYNKADQLLINAYTNTFQGSPVK